MRLDSINLDEGKDRRRVLDITVIKPSSSVKGWENVD
jgi:hypothetical protein